MKTLLLLATLVLPLGARAETRVATELRESVNDAVSSVLEMNTDRPGYDYRSFNLRRAYWRDCADVCVGDRRCRTWTYVRPGIQGPYARCWLKWAIPPARYSTCCISGTN